jgi:transposase-like protein
VFRTITGEHHYLWRVVDQEGHVLDILRRDLHDRATATTFCRKLLKCAASGTKSAKFQPFFRKALIDLE